MKLFLQKRRAKITDHFRAQNYIISATISSPIIVNFALWKSAGKSCVWQQQSDGLRLIAAWTHPYQTETVGYHNTTASDRDGQMLIKMSNEKLLKAWQKKSGDRQKLYKIHLHRANKNDTLKILPELHEEAFENINCLDCAACCRNYSPRFKATDVKRISKRLGMKEGVFIETYLNLDEDNDYVVRTKPCPFLGEDNYCSIYEDRPSDCARFPYTDEDVIIKRQQLTLKNSTFCPAVYFVLEKLMERKG